MSLLKTYIDWEYYISIYDDVADANIDSVYKHWLDIGQCEHRINNKNFMDDIFDNKKYKNSYEYVCQNAYDNFDWKFYVKNNNLQIDNSVDARVHRDDNLMLKYCKSYNILINIHLQNLELFEEIIDQINYFMKINCENNFIIMITVPIDDQMGSKYYGLSKLENSTPGLTFSGGDKNEFFIKSLSNTPYHKYLIKQDLLDILYNINVTSHKLNINPDNIQFVYMKNNNTDIGGLFMCLDQANQRGISYDIFSHVNTNYLINKAHRSLSIFNYHINVLLNDYNYIANRYQYYPYIYTNKHKQHIETVRDQYQLNFKSQDYINDATFICKKNKEFTKLINAAHEIFNSLNIINESAYEKILSLIYNKKIYLLDKPKKQNILGIFACHSNMMVKTQTTLNNLEKLIHNFDKIIIVDSKDSQYCLLLKNLVEAKYKDKLQAYILANNGKCLDFEKWLGAIKITNLDDFDYVTFINDSVVLTDKIDTYFSFLDGKKELFGMNNSWEIRYHYQSFFFSVHTKKMDMFVVFCLDKFKNVECQYDLICQVELKFIDLFDNKDCYIKIHSKQFVNNIYIVRSDFYNMLLDNKILPIIKIKRLYDDKYVQILKNELNFAVPENELGILRR